MPEFLIALGQSLAGSPANQMAIDLLRNVPGLPPIVQTIHILSIAAVMASVVFLALRSLGVAVPSQDPREMVERLMPWTWAALLLLALSGGLLILARPLRYFANPVFGWKMLFLVAALLLTGALLRLINRPAGGTLSRKLIAGSVLVFWVLTVLAGRWIAYSEYLFAPA